MKPAHSEACRHVPFDVSRGDRADRSFSSAIARANRRAQWRGVRQTVRRHVGPITGPIYFLQDVREVAS